jgi:hypothetical protein
MAVPRSLRKEWEKRFSDLSGPWTHWRLEGDGYLLGLVPGEKLLDALRLVEENYGRYSSIKVARATVNALGECTAVETHLREVSNFENDERLRARLPADPSKA